MTEKTALYHEVGHWMVAYGLGYKNLAICPNPPRFILKDSEKRETQDYKNKLLISFGGLAAEKLLDIPLNAGHIWDLQIACEYLKKLKNLEGKVFNYKNYMDFPNQDFDYYLEQAKIALTQLGGKEKNIRINRRNKLK